MRLFRRLFGRRFSVSATLLGLVAMSTLMAPASRADSVVDQLGPDAVEFRATTAAGDVVICGLDINNPHWSSGAGSVIYKTRILCDDDAQVLVEGTLLYVAGGSPGNPAQGPGQVAATSAQTQNVTAGVIRTYYTPEQDGSNVTRDGTYGGSSRGQIMEPCCSNVGSDSTSYVYINVP